MHQISKVLENKKTKDKILIKFEGIEKKKDLDLNKIDNLLEISLENKLCNYNDIPNIVSLVKTILKDFDEQYLLISSSSDFKGIENFYIVDYIKTDLNKFAIYKKPDFFNSALFEYQKNKEIKFSISLELSNNYKEFFDKNVDILEKLKKLEPKKLDDESKLICQLYQIFYNEAPDFSKDETLNRIQNMAVILSSFNIHLNSDYYFKVAKDKIISYPLQVKINDLLPFGLIDKIDEPLVLNKKIIEKIKIIGEEIKNKTNYDLDKLNNLSYLIHIAHYNLNNTDKETIKKYNKDNKFTTEEIEYNIGIIQKTYLKLKN